MRLIVFQLAANFLPARHATWTTEVGYLHCAAERSEQKGAVHFQMILPDVNVLIYAFRRDLPPAYALPCMARGRRDERCPLWLVAFGIGCRRSGHHQSACDAWFAVLDIEWGCEWITLDLDYAQFPELARQVPTVRAPA